MIRGVILLIATVAVSALVGAGTASAVSPYDNLIQNTSSLKLKTDQGSTTCSNTDIDISVTWPEMFKIPTGTQWDEIVDTTDGHRIAWNDLQGLAQQKASFVSAWNSKTFWSVVQYDAPNYGVKTIKITWTTASDAKVIFSTVNGRKQLSYDKQQYTLNLALSNGSTYGDNGCRLSVSHNNPYDNYILQEADSVYTPKVYFVYGNIEYPSGYEGMIPNDSAPEPPVITDFKPDFYVSAARDWKSMIHDKNFNTFDGNPFLCSEDLAPVLHFTIWDISENPEVILETASVSATAQIEYQFPQIATKTKYRIDGYYDCGSPPEIQFNEVGSKEFEIDRNGNLVIAGFSSCVQPEAPFVFIDQCLIGVNDMLAILAFKDTTPSIENANLISVANQNPNNCYTMGTLGDWIGREDQYLCPAFPANVRNTVTPFIMFVLAGTVLYFISRSKGNII